MTALAKKPLELLVITVLAWGISFPVIKATLANISPLPFLWYRLVLASLFLTPLVFHAWKISGEYLSIRRTLLLTFLGLIGPVLSLILLYLGMNLTMASRAVVLMSISPIITRLTLKLFGINRQSVNPIGLLAVISGIIVILAEPLFNASRIDFAGSVTGNILVLMSALTWALYTVIAKVKFAKNIEKNSPVTMLALSFLAGAALLTPLVYWQNPRIILAPLDSLDKAVIPGVLYLALISSILGFMTFDAAVKLVGPKLSSRFLYLQPLIAVPIALLWLGEPLSMIFLSGAGIIAIGVYLYEVNPSDLLSRNRRYLRLRP